MSRSTRRREGGAGRAVTGRPRVAVCIVAYHAAADLPACLAAVGRQRLAPEELVVVDCGGGGDLEVAAEHAPDGVRCVFRDAGANLGFAGGMNLAFELSRAPLVLMLNADAVLDPSFLERAAERFDGEGSRVAAVAGRLVRPPGGDGAVLDACGMRLTLGWRHLDRGSSAPDRGQYSVAERVFGATGAASLFRRRALEDAAVDGEILLTEFHSFREDAELAFRLRERGWEVLYEPSARAVHRRRSLPGRRRQLPAAVNYHSLKNRYLLRAYHQTLPNVALTAVPTLLRDLAALAYVLAFERGSLAAYGWLWAHRREILERRRRIAARRRCGWWEVDRWFVRRGLPA